MHLFFDRRTNRDHILCVFQMATGIKRYFEHFGEVESIRKHTTRQSQFAFVQYKSVDAARAALSKSVHRVGKCTMTVKPAHEKHQPDFKAFKPPKQDSPQHILNALNDDCLERVFKQFELPDLSVAADVCVRFQNHAIDAFTSKYKHVIKMEHVSEFQSHPGKFEMMLRNFGSLIHTLSINQVVLKTDAFDLLKLINKHMPALKSLKLYNFGVAENVLELHPLFAKLQALTLSRCALTNGAEELLKPCAELKQLTIIDVDWDNYCIDHTFPKLEEVHLASCTTIDEAEFKKFITSNRTLKKLSIHDNSELKSASIIQLIGKNLTDLVELEIQQEHFERDSQFQKCTLSLSRLSSLQNLTLNNNGLSVKALLSKLAEKAVSLERLALTNGSIDSSAIKSMSELVKLNGISLKNIKNLKDDHLVVLAKGLPQLRELHLHGNTAEDITIHGVRNMLGHATKLSQLVLQRASNIQITKHDYTAMLKTVQERAENRQLVIEITGNGDKVGVPESLLAANREWLWIDENIDDDDDEDNANFAMLAIHIFLDLQRHFMMHHNDSDSDESSDEEMDQAYDEENFDLD